MSTTLNRVIGSLCVLLAALTAACGGGNDSPADGGTTSKVLPAPPVSPAIPAAEEVPFALTELRDFPTLGLSYRYTANTNGSQPEGPSGPSGAETVSISYLATEQAYEMAVPGVEPGRLTLLQRGSGYAVHALGTRPGPVLSVYLYRHQLPSGAFLDHTAFGEWDGGASSETQTGRASLNVGAFAYGVPTPVGSVPSAGRRTYSATIVGRTSASLGVWYVFGTANLTFDFAAGGLSGNLVLGINPGGPGHMSFGTFELAATEHAVGATSFSGKFRLPGGLEDGFLEGRFTGPTASELMLRWLLPQPAQSGSLFGVAVGGGRDL